MTRWRFPLRTEKWPFVPTKRWIVFWILLLLVTSFWVCTRRVPDPYGLRKPDDALGLSVAACRWDPTTGSLRVDVTIEVLDDAHDVVEDLSDRLRASSMGVAYESRPGHQVDVSDAWRPGSDPLSASIEMDGLPRRPVAVRLFVTELSLDEPLSIATPRWTQLAGAGVDTPFGRMKVEEAWVEGSVLWLSYVHDPDWMGGDLAFGGPALMELRAPGGTVTGVQSGDRHTRDLFYQEVRFDTRDAPDFAEQVRGGTVSLHVARWTVDAASTLRFETAGTCSSG